MHPACARRPERRTLLLFALAATFLIQSPFSVAHASPDVMTALKRVYAGLLTFKVFHHACDRAVPANAPAHRAAYKWFATRHSLDRIEAFFAVRPNPVPGLEQVNERMERSAARIGAQIAARPQTCAALGPFLEALVRRNLRRPGITKLGTHFDLLLAEADLEAPPPAKPDRPKRTPPVSTGKGKKLNTALLMTPRLWPRSMRF